VDFRAPKTIAQRIRHAVWTVLGAVALTSVFFLVLPFIQAIHKGPAADLVLQTVSTADVPPPPPPPEEEPEEEEEPEPEPPQMQEDLPQLDLSQLELALNPGVSGDLFGAEMMVRLNPAAAADGAEAIFSQSDLDQAPLPVHQPAPKLTAQMRQRAPGKVVVIFEVDANGRVQTPRVRSSTDPVFESAVLAAIRQWRFEPGKRNGEAVRTRALQSFVIPR